MRKSGVKRIFCLAYIALILPMMIACSPMDYVSKEAVVFGSDIVFVGKALGKNSVVALDEMVAELQKINESVAVNLPSSSISKLNSASVSERVEIDYCSYTLLKRAKELNSLTAGAFDITTLPLSRLWNIDIAGYNKYHPKYGVITDMPLSLPAQDEIAEALKLVGSDAIDIVCEGEKYYATKNKAVEIDLGGIAKGYGADRCEEIAEKYALDSAVINISGNIYAYGKVYNGASSTPNWTIRINNPRPKMTFFRDSVCAFTSTQSSIVTSGDYERFYFYNYNGIEGATEENSLAIPHILSPLTGLPIGVAYDEKELKYVATPHVISATVLSESSMDGDAVATAICVLGLEEGIKLLNKLGLKGIIFTSDYKMSIVGDISLTGTDIYNEYLKYEMIKSE